MLKGVMKIKSLKNNILSFALPSVQVEVTVIMDAFCIQQGKMKSNPNFD